MINLKQKEDFFFSTFNEINNLLKKYKIEAWVDAGILLKYFRKQNIFPSSDIDFGVKYQDIKNVIHFANTLKSKDYLVTTLSNFPLLFEGLSIQKKLNEDFIINIDIYFYYPIKKFLCRPNMHKPLKQDFFSVFLFIILNKLIRTKAKKENNKFLLKYIFSTIVYIVSWLYFTFAKTTQFAIPSEYLKELESVEINKNRFLMPKNIKQYIIWRYGPEWKTQNKNWRLTDGNMVFLNNLKNFWHYYTSSKDFSNSKILTIENKKKRQSIFTFSKNEIIKIKKSKIKSQLC